MSAGCDKKLDKQKVSFANALKINENLNFEQFEHSSINNSNISVNIASAEYDSKIVRDTPSQNLSKYKIIKLQSQIAILTNVENLDFCGEDKALRIKKLKEKLYREEKLLKRKISDANRKRKSRRIQATQLKKLKKSNPKAFVNAEVNYRDGIIGRPRLEVDQPDLLKTITEIAMIGGAADNRRRSESNYS